MTLVATPTGRSTSLLRGSGWLIVVILGACSLIGCQSHRRAPIEQKLPTTGQTRPTAGTSEQAAGRSTTARPAEHVVARGDTVHAIAWRYGIDSRDLVRWNRLSNPDLILVGQRLRLTPPEQVAAQTPTVSRPPPSRAAPSVPATRARPLADAAPAAPGPSRAPSGWVWPAEGTAAHARGVSGTRGIQIRGKKGQDVKAAAAGTVVYSGSGLRGYGELIIIKHDETYLSAYAHNDARLVEEGQSVKSGQVIARMGNTEARETMLHFEIRRNGKSVDPYQYLPKR